MTPLRRRISVRLICAAIAATSLYSCTSSDHDTYGVARPHAYPRTPLCDTIYTDRALPGRFLTNAQATVADVTPADNASPARWIDIRYPAYRATIHCTFIPVTDSSRPDIVANRMERMMLNIGSNFAEQTQLQSPAGWQSTILLTGTEAPTPLQFLSVGPDWVANGALRFDADSLSTDSVMPILQAIKADILHAAKRL